MFRPLQRFIKSPALIYSKRYSVIPYYNNGYYGLNSFTFPTKNNFLSDTLLPLSSSSSTMLKLTTRLFGSFKPITGSQTSVQERHEDQLSFRSLLGYAFNELKLIPHKTSLHLHRYLVHSLVDVIPQQGKQFNAFNVFYRYHSARIDKNVPNKKRFLIKLWGDLPKNEKSKYDPKYLLRLEKELDSALYSGSKRHIQVPLHYKV